MIEELTRVPEIEAQIASAVESIRLGRPCYAFDEIGSTMDAAHRFAADGAPEGTVIWSERQTAGRGRSGRLWVSPRGGLYLSIILRPSRDYTELPQLALLGGLAAAQAIHALTNLPARVRWPNDVLLQDQKLVGVLTELTTDRGGARYAVVGVGINVTIPADELPPGATTLSRWVAVAPDRVVLAAAWLRALDHAYLCWSAEGFAPLRTGLVQWSGVFGKIVHITTPKDRFGGQAMDIDEQGRLLVRLDSGMMRAVDMGEVALLR